jgi:hypothetical protein
MFWESQIGIGEEVTVSETFEHIESASFSYLKTLSVATFEFGNRISSLGDSALPLRFRSDDWPL